MVDGKLPRAGISILTSLDTFTNVLTGVSYIASYAGIAIRISDIMTSRAALSPHQSGVFSDSWFTRAFCRWSRNTDARCMEDDKTGKKARVLYFQYVLLVGTNSFIQRITLPGHGFVSTHTFGIEVGLTGCTLRHSHVASKGWYGQTYTIPEIMWQCLDVNEREFHVFPL